MMGGQFEARHFDPTLDSTLRTTESERDMRKQGTNRKVATMATRLVRMPLFSPFLFH